MPIPYGQKAVNPQTGHMIILTPQGWVDAGSPQMPLPQGDEDAMKALHGQNQDAQFLDQKAQQFMRTMGAGQNGVATGPGYQVVEIPHIAENINPARTIMAARDPRVGDLQSITNQTWVHMRPTGSGRLMQPEVEGFQQAFPNLENFGPVNDRIANHLHQDALIAASKLQFIDSYIRAGLGDYAAANAAWTKGGNGYDPQGNVRQFSAPPPPTPMTADPNSPIGYSPTPQAQQGPSLNPPGPQGQSANPPSPQTAPLVLNWTPEKGLHP